MKQCSICLSHFDPFDYVDCPTCRDEISKCQTADYIELLVEIKNLSKENDRLIGESKKFRNESIEIIHDLSANNTLLKERIDKLESAVREFLEHANAYEIRDIRNLVLEHWAASFKELLEGEK